MAILKVAQSFGRFNNLRCQPMIASLIMTDAEQKSQWLLQTRRLTKEFFALPPESSPFAQLHRVNLDIEVKFHETTTLKLAGDI